MQKQTHDKKLFPRLLPLITLIGCSWLVGCSTAQLPAKIALPQNHLDASGAVLGGVKSGYKLAQSGGAGAARKSARGTVAVVQPTAVPGPKVAKVTLAPVTVSRKLDAQPYNPARVVVGQSIPDSVPDNLSQWVLVSGNYTPKGIYSRPTYTCLLYTSPSPRDRQKSRMPSSA